MKKRLISCVICLCMLIGVMGLTPVAHAETTSGVCGDNLTWSFDDETGTLTISGSGPMTNYSNSTAPWHTYQSAITSAEIGDFVTTIGRYAFDNCWNLTSVTIGNSVTSLGDCAFFNCKKLDSVTIPDSVTSIGADAFGWCGSLMSVTIGDNVTYLGDHAFEWCTSLTSARIGNGLGRIGDSAFIWCTNLENVTIGNSVTNIGAAAFLNCDSLTSVTIPGSVHSVGSRALADCDKLTEIVVDATNEYYSSDKYGVLFNNDKTVLVQCPGGFTGAYNIPNSVVSIDNHAFEECRGLTRVTIPDSVTSIGTDAFSWCEALKDVTIGNSVTSISNYAFYGCSGLTTLTIPDSVTVIGKYAFYNCYKMACITLPESLTIISDAAFMGCNGLGHILYKGTAQQWGTISISSTYNDVLANTMVHYDAEGDEVCWKTAENGMCLYCELCDDALTEVEAPFEVYVEALKPVMSIVVGAEMSVAFTVPNTAIAKYESFFLVVEKEVYGNSKVVIFGYGEDQIPLDPKPNAANPFLHNASFTGLTAKEMGDEIRATLYAVDAEGIVYYGPTQTDSVKDYLMRGLDLATSTDAKKTMYVDMLRYGAVAQTYLGYDTENLVDADLTEAHMAYATSEIPEAIDKSKSVGNIRVLNTSVVLKARVTLTLSTVFPNADITNMKFVVRDAKTGAVLKELAATRTNPVLVSADFDDVGAKQMRRLITVTLYDDDTAMTDTVTWSVESYVAKTRATSTDAGQIDLVNAMLTYGDAVAAYMATQ